MLNMYDGILKLVNPKLYHSPYKVNIDQVRNILNNFSYSCQINFLNNLLTLEINAMSEDEILKDASVGGTYNLKNNYILLGCDDGSINHELFHVTNNIRKRKIFLGKNRGFGFEALLEGITEYLNMKSMNMKTSNSYYQTEILVTEILVFIFGEKVLEPYFKNQHFLYQFGAYYKKGKLIIKPDIIALNILKALGNLENVSDNFNSQYYRLRHLLFTDLAPNLLDDNEYFLMSLGLNYKTDLLLSNQISANVLEISKKYPKEVTYDILGLEKCSYKDSNKEKIRQAYILEYNNIQRNCFREILENLIEVALKKGITYTEISQFIYDKVYYKDDWFKELFNVVIDDVLEKQPVRKR